MKKLLRLKAQPVEKEKDFWNMDIDSNHPHHHVALGCLHDIQLSPIGMSFYNSQSFEMLKDSKDVGINTSCLIIKRQEVG